MQGQFDDTVKVYYNHHLHPFDSPQEIQTKAKVIFGMSPQRSSTDLYTINIPFSFDPTAYYSIIATVSPGVGDGKRSSVYIYNKKNPQVLSLEPW